MRSVAAIIFLLLGVGFATAAERPNVLLICVDDLKPMLGCYGDATINSPNIDAQANRGVMSKRAYCNQAVCAPSRNALLTGYRSTTLGIYDLGTNFRFSKPDAVTLPQYFKQNGYRTEGMGKIFHHGHGNHDDEASWSVPFWRSDVVNYALKEHADANKNSREAALFNNATGKKAKDLAKGVAYESADVADNVYPDGQTADEAIKRLAQAAKDPKQPFFLAVGFVKPHLPFCAPKKYWDMYDPEKFKLAERPTLPDGSPPYAGHTWQELRNYAGMPDEGPVSDDEARKLIHGYHAAVSYMDAQVGRVLEALKKDGFADNTIVVLWGDHGWHLGDHGLWCKHTNFEEAAHIPFMIYDPRANGVRGKTDSMVESVDLYPTLCQLAGLPAPKGLDGKSFAKVLDDPKAPTKDYILHSFPRGARIGNAVRTPRYRLVEWRFPGEDLKKAAYELYDYEADPGENKNLIDDKPEIAKELKAILAKYPDPKVQIHPNAGPKRANGRNAGKKAAQRTGGGKKANAEKNRSAADLRPKNIVTREQWGSTPDPIPDARKHTPEWITIHHAGVLWTNKVEPAQFVRNMQAWGKKRPEIEKPPRDTFWPDLPYHFMIAPNGDIYEARPVEYEPESNTKYELAGNLGIELMGDFEKQRPSVAQLESTARLAAWLMKEHGIDFARVRTHRDAAKGQTSCPGRDFYRYMEDGEFRKWVNRATNGKDLNIDPGPPLENPAGPTELITATRAR